MGYHLTISLAPPSARSLASPKTHTPLPRLQERGLRYFQPESGRWASRDPIGEVGGANLYLLLANNANDRADLIGAVPWDLIGIIAAALDAAIDGFWLPDWIDDQIIDFYGGPEGFMNATETRLAAKGELPRDMFHKSRERDASAVNESTPIGVRVQSAALSSAHYVARRDFIIGKLQTGTSYIGFVHVDFQDADEAVLGYAIGGGQLHYEYSPATCKCEFTLKDIYDFTAKGHAWGRLQERGFLVTYPVDVLIEEKQVSGVAPPQ